jgi:hypothetical protein
MSRQADSSNLLSDEEDEDNEDSRKKKLKKVQKNFRPAGERENNARGARQTSEKISPCGRKTPRAERAIQLLLVYT